MSRVVATTSVASGISSVDPGHRRRCADFGATCRVADHAQNEPGVHCRTQREFSPAQHAVHRIARRRASGCNSLHMRALGASARPCRRAAVQLLRAGDQRYHRYRYGWRRANGSQCTGDTGHDAGHAGLLICTSLESNAQAGRKATETQPAGVVLLVAAMVAPRLATGGHGSKSRPGQCGAAA